MAEVTIPNGIGEVDAAWMTAALRDAGTIADTTSVSALEATQVGQGVGLMGEIFVAALTYEGDAGDAPASVVVKLPATAEANREQGIALGMYEAECRFYDEMVERTGEGLPVIHQSKIVSGTGDFVIVMEDLSYLDQVDQTVGMSLDQARAAVRSLAGVHAAWWDDVADDSSVGWIPSATGERIAMVDQMLPPIWEITQQGFADFIPAEGGKELGDAFSTNYLNLMAGLSARSPWTLCHQDYRVDNMLFGDPAKDEVVIIDWQGMGRGPGAYDVAYILGGSLPIDVRREHEESLVASYHERLVASGVAGYTLGQMWDDYRYAHLLGGLATSLFAAGTLDLSNERGVQLIGGMLKRHMTAALDHGGFAASGL